MSKFKVGDTIMDKRFPGSPYHTVVDIAELSIIIRINNVWDTSFPIDIIKEPFWELTEIYNSPLYKLMKEDE